MLPPDNFSGSRDAKQPAATSTKKRKQPTMFDAGATCTMRLQNKTILLAKPLSEPKEVQTSQQKKKRNTRLQCRWCDQMFNHAPARTQHEKSHNGPMPMQAGQKSLFDIKKLKEQMSEKQRDKEIEVQVRWCIGDIIKELEKTEVPITIIAGRSGKPLRYRKNGEVDKRSYGRGAQTRQGRSQAFKYKIILRVDTLKAEYPEFNSECAELVADQYNIDKSQVYRWIKQREQIKKNALSKNKNQQRDRKQKGRFARAEAEVFMQFKACRAVGKRVGPSWLKQAARREVRKAYAGTPMQEESKLFGAKTGWITRFCSRWKICLRRKTNVKRTPIEERVGKIRRYFALFRVRLCSFRGKPGYDVKWSLWPMKNRWSLDQVPAGFFAPTSTYELKGARRVHIASNGSADSHRECTLQVCIRAYKNSSLPRHGQPKLVIAFKGKGKRISDVEKNQYNENVIVMWDPKAWYNSKMCNEWATLAALEIVKKSEGPHLILADNLHGQTTEEFKSILKKNSDATLHLLLAGCTDEIQVVDAGFGALIKHYAQEVSDEWLMEDVNWQEWCGTSLSASRRRVLLTNWYGEGYVRACASYDFVKHFQQTGSGLTADGSEDDKIKLQGLASFEFDAADADRDAITGNFVESQEVSSLETEAAVESDEECEDLSEDENASDKEDSDGGDETEPEDEDPDPYAVEDGYEVVKEYRFAGMQPKDLIGISFAYKFTSGWERGKVVGIEKNKSSDDYGMFIVKFITERNKRCLALESEDYDVDDIWVEVKRKAAPAT